MDPRFRYQCQAPLDDKALTQSKLQWKGGSVKRFSACLQANREFLVAINNDAIHTSEQRKAGRLAQRGFTTCRSGAIFTGSAIETQQHVTSTVPVRIGLGNLPLHQIVLHIVPSAISTTIFGPPPFALFMNLSPIHHQRAQFFYH